MPKIKKAAAKARRVRILDAAVEIFVQRGYHNTTIRDIAKKANVADGTIYNYYKNKPALLIAIFERLQDEVETDIGLPPTPTETNLHPHFTLMFHQALAGLQVENFALFRIITAEIMVNQELRQLFRQQILNPMLAGTEAQLHAYADAGFIVNEAIPVKVQIIAGLVIGLIYQFALTDSNIQEHWDTLPETLATVLLDGLIKKDNEK